MLIYLATALLFYSSITEATCPTKTPPPPPPPPQTTLAAPNPVNGDDCGDCDNSVGLVCLNGLCQCQPDQFWDGNACVSSPFYAKFVNVGGNSMASYTVQTSVNFHLLRSLVKYNSKYYVADESNNAIYVFNNDWSYSDTKTAFDQPHAIEHAGSNFYVSSSLGLSKADNNLDNYEFTYTGDSLEDVYRSVLYDGSQILAVNDRAGVVDFFDLGLNLINSVSVGSGAYGIAKYNNKYYISTVHGKIKVLDGTSVSEFSTQCADLITQIAIDSTGVIIVPCFHPQQVFLHHVNGTYLNKHIVVESPPTYAGFDLNNNVVVVSKNHVHVF